MAVQIPTVDGLADYKVVTALKTLEAAANRAEVQIGQLTAANSTLQAQTASLQRELDATNRLVQQLQRQVTEL